MWLVISLISCSTTELKGGTGYIQTVRTNTAGRATFEIEIDGSTDGFLLTAEANGWVAMETISNPQGEVVFTWEEWWDAEENITSSIWPLSWDSTTNWPIRASDEALEEGTWTVTVGVFNEDGDSMAWRNVAGTVQTKEDTDLTAGTIAVTVAFTDTVQNDDAVMAAADQAMDRWREIWAQMNVDVAFTIIETDISSDLPYPDDEAIQQLSEEGSETDVLMIIGETVNDSTDYYGFAGSIPGPLVATPRAAVVVGWLAHAGIDGEFDDQDIRIFGETMAHETGHYLGLFHPVEAEYDGWDALGDTPYCESESECHELMKNNLMFPYPVCGFSTCQPQGELTEQQGGVMHRYVGVR